MAYPIMAPGHTWYKTSVLRSAITSINIVDSYTETGNETESWNADIDDSGSIKCYLTDTVLTIAGNGSGKIALNEDSSFLFSYPIENTDTGDVLFINCSAITGLSVFDTSNVISMRTAFGYCIAVTELDLTGWDVSWVETMRYMFGAHNSIGVMALTTLTGISDWNTGNVTTTRAMFQNCSALTELDVSKWDMSSVTEANHMFFNCASLTTIPVSDWNTGNVTTMASMFGKCTALETLDVSKWDTSKVTTMANMFSMNDYGQNAPPLSALDVSNWDVSNVTDMGWTFYGLANLKTLDLSKWNVSKVESFHHCFAWCGSLVVSGYENWDVSSAKTMNAMFHNIRNITYDVSKWNVSNVESFAQMFEQNFNLTNIYGLENWDTSNGKAFYEMFFSCMNLKSLDLSSFDTRNANESWIDPQRGTTGGGIYKMFGLAYDESSSHCLRNLTKVTIGKNFSFNGDGTCTAALLPAPLAAYLEDADGYWYDNNGNKFTPEEIPNLTAGTYYAVEGMTEKPYLVKSNTLYSLRKAVCSKIGVNEKLTPEQMIMAVNGLETMDDFWDNFWDVYQIYGARDDCDFMFAGVGWYATNLKPKYPIPPITRAMSMFARTNFNGDLAAHFESLGITLDFSKTAHTSQCFANARYITRIPRLDLTSTVSGGAIFHCCRSLKTIDSIVYPERNVGDNFVECESLENITIEGVIAYTINLQWSPLTKDSMKSIITHLKDYSGTDSASTYSIKFSDNCWTNLDAEGPTSPNGNLWSEYVLDLGWLK